MGWARSRFKGSKRFKIGPFNGSRVQKFKVSFGQARGTGPFKGSTIKLFVPFQQFQPFHRFQR